MINYRTDPAFAKSLDAADPLARFRTEFYIPKTKEGKDSIYLCGNSLGLQHNSIGKAINQELEDWKNLGVEGHVQAKTPWMPYHEYLSDSMARIVGAKSSEVVVMNSLTTNLHLLFASFYRPTTRRYKIVIEQDAFPSDRYVVQSQMNFHRYHGNIPKDSNENSILIWKSKPNKSTLDFEELEGLMKQHGEQVALVFIGGVNYYTGQYFDLKAISDLAHQYGSMVGFDLAHAVGNLDLKLHQSGADFAAWCSYKYLNSGPGGIAGIFVHERHKDFQNKPRFTGWWGHNKQTRFKMRDAFDPLPGAEAWQLSNPPIFQLASLKASLNVFDRAGMDKLREKSIKLTGYMEYLLRENSSKNFELITPDKQNERGCQLSIKIKDADRSLFEQISKKGVIADWREPDVIRVAPVPLYNSFEDVWNFVNILNSCH